MQKTLKRITLILAAIMAVACMGIFASACGTKDSFKVTVVYAENNSPVDGTASGLTVQICTAQLNGTLIKCYTIHDVDAKGKTTVTLPENGELKANTQYHLQLNNLPDGYEYHEDETFLTKPKSFTIKLYKV